MLARRKPPRMRSGDPQCAYPRHRKFVRGHVCIVPGCLAGSIEAAHVRAGLPASVPSWARGGTGKKSHDGFTYSCCREHHALSHRIGEHTFARQFGIAPLKEAIALAKSSPVPEVREFIRSLKL